MYDVQEAIYFKRRARTVEDCTTHLVRGKKEERHSKNPKLMRTCKLDKRVTIAMVKKVKEKKNKIASIDEAIKEVREKVEEEQKTTATLLNHPN